MGYTHYWSFRNATKGKAAEIENTYKAALTECQRVILAYQAYCAENDLTDERLSGYSAHVKVRAYGGLNINGKGENGHETFAMREHYSENEPSFCKTDRKPYDIVVVACLAILKYRLGDLIDVSSDGKAKDWESGVALARNVLKRKGIKNPIEAKTETVAGTAKLLNGYVRVA